DFRLGVAETFATGTAEGIEYPAVIAMEYADIEIALKLLPEAIIMRMVYPGIAHIGHLPTLEQQFAGYDDILAHDGAERETAHLFKRLAPVSGKGVGAGDG